jgi:mycothiol synthase
MSIGFASPGAQVVLGQEIPASHTAALALLRASGYQPVRYISRLQMPLEPPPPDPVTPDGIVIRPYRGQTELPQVVRAFEEALRDQWGHLEEPFEESLAEWEAWIATSQRFDPGLWLLATDGQEIAGAILSEGATVEDPQMGSVSEFGVRRPWRRRGIGTALLLSLLRELRRRGFERAALSAGADSLTGATHLYERIGFRPDWQSIVMEKELRPGRDPRAQSAAP